MATRRGVPDDVPAQGERKRGFLILMSAFATVSRADGVETQDPVDPSTRSRPDAREATLRAARE